MRSGWAQESLRRFASGESGVVLTSPITICGVYGGINAESADLIIVVDEDWSGRCEEAMADIVERCRFRRQRQNGIQKPDRDKNKVRLLRLVCSETIEDTFMGNKQLKSKNEADTKTDATMVTATDLHGYIVGTPDGISSLGNFIMPCRGKKLSEVLQVPINMDESTTFFSSGSVDKKSPLNDPLFLPIPEPPSTANATNSSSSDAEPLSVGAIGCAFAALEEYVSPLTGMGWGNGVPTSASALATSVPAGCRPIVPPPSETSFTSMEGHEDFLRAPVLRALERNLSRTHRRTIVPASAAALVTNPPLQCGQRHPTISDEEAVDAWRQGGLGRTPGERALSYLYFNLENGSDKSTTAISSVAHFPAMVSKMRRDDPASFVETVLYHPPVIPGYLTPGTGGHTPSTSSSADHHTVPGPSQNTNTGPVTLPLPTSVNSDNKISTANVHPLNKLLSGNSMNRTSKTTTSKMIGICSLPSSPSHQPAVSSTRSPQSTHVRPLSYPPTLQLHQPQFQPKLLPPYNANTIKTQGGSMVSGIVSSAVPSTAPVASTMTQPSLPAATNTVTAPTVLSTTESKNSTSDAVNIKVAPASESSAMMTTKNATTIKTTTTNIAQQKQHQTSSLKTPSDSVASLEIKQEDNHFTHLDILNLTDFPSITESAKVSSNTGIVTSEYRHWRDEDDEFESYHDHRLGPLDLLSNDDSAIDSNCHDNGLWLTDYMGSQTESSLNSVLLYVNRPDPPPSSSSRKSNKKQKKNANSSTSSGISTTPTGEAEMAKSAIATAFAVTAVPKIFNSSTLDATPPSSVIPAAAAMLDEDAITMSRIKLRLSSIQNRASAVRSLEHSMASKSSAGPGMPLTYGRPQTPAHPFSLRVDRQTIETGDASRINASAKRNSLRKILTSSSSSSSRHHHVHKFGQPAVDFGPFGGPGLVHHLDNKIATIQPAKARTGISLPMGVHVVHREKHFESEPWSFAEDEILVEVAKRYGFNWHVASQYTTSSQANSAKMSNKGDYTGYRRSARQCQQRWQHLVRTRSDLVKEVNDIIVKRDLDRCKTPLPSPVRTEKPPKLEDDADAMDIVKNDAPAMTQSSSQEKDKKSDKNDEKVGTKNSAEEATKTTKPGAGLNGKRPLNATVSVNATSIPPPSNEPPSAKHSDSSSSFLSRLKNLNTISTKNSSKNRNILQGIIPPTVEVRTIAPPHESHAGATHTASSAITSEVSDVTSTELWPLQLLEVLAKYTAKHQKRKTGNGGNAANVTSSSSSGTGAGPTTMTAPTTAKAPSQRQHVQPPYHSQSKVNIPPTAKVSSTAAAQKLRHHHNAAAANAAAVKAAVVQRMRTASSAAAANKTPEELHAAAKQQERIKQAARAAALAPTISKKSERNKNANVAANVAANVPSATLKGNYPLVNSSSIHHPGAMLVPQQQQQMAQQQLLLPSNDPNKVSGAGTGAGAGSGAGAGPGTTTTAGGGITPASARGNHLPPMMHPSLKK